MLKYAVVGLNIGAGRVGSEERDHVLGGIHKGLYNGSHKASHSRGYAENKWQGNTQTPKKVTGRYPANLIHDGSEEATGGMPWTKTGSHSGTPYEIKSYQENCATSIGKGIKTRTNLKPIDGSEGSASGYFYCAKASKSDRNEGLDDRNIHPTVKPTALMQYVTKLITPINGTVLDPFMGSGSTGKACMLEGFNFTGIELSSEYLAIAEARIQHAQSLASRKQLKLEV